MKATHNEAKGEPEGAKVVQHRGHEIFNSSIRAPAFSYLNLQLVSNTANIPILDELSLRFYLTSTLERFLGLTGSAISIDLLNTHSEEYWIRVPHEDLSVVVAALGGWVEVTEVGDRLGWKVKAAGNWLSALLPHAEVSSIWQD